MSEMVKRVARAICLNGLDDGTRACCEDCTVKLSQARAAIVAMREPTKAMCKANWTMPISGGVDDGWRMMIDEALKP